VDPGAGGDGMGHTAVDATTVPQFPDRRLAHVYHRIDA
jgi:hypothetical protein